MSIQLSSLLASQPSLWRLGGSAPPEGPRNSVHLGLWRDNRAVEGPNIDIIISYSGTKAEEMLVIHTIK